ncbi:MAG: carboxylesterase family protein [Pseudomonadota bacterium]
MNTPRLALLSGILLLFQTSAHAALPENVRSVLKEIGNTVDPLTTAAAYLSLQDTPPQKSVGFTRDMAYGPDARQILDIAAPARRGARLAVLVFLPGGLGDKRESFPGGEPFYDNVILWAAKNNMIGVNVQRRGAFRDDINGEDVGVAVRWLHANIKRYGGDPARMIIWGHSAGAMSLADYLSRRQFQGPDGVLVRGAILMSGPYSLAPLVPPGAEDFKLRFGKDATPVGMPPMPALSEQELAATSILPGLKALGLPLLLVAAERDPTLLLNSTMLLNDELRKAGRRHALLILKEHNHSSEVFSVNTEDRSVSAPLLEWIHSVQ